MTDRNNMIRSFWAHVCANIAATGMLVGFAMGFHAIEEDAGFYLTVGGGILLALGQLINRSSKFSIFVRCGLLMALPVLGMSAGMQTFCLIRGDTGSGISGHWGLDCLILLAYSMMFGTIAGTVGVLVTFLSDKICPKCRALPSPLASDPTYSRQARLLATEAPFLFALYAFIRFFTAALLSPSPPSTSGGFFSLYQFMESQNRLNWVLGIVDIVFSILAVGAAVWLLTRAVKTKRTMATCESN